MMPKTFRTSRAAAVFRELDARLAEEGYRASPEDVKTIVEMARQAMLFATQSEEHAELLAGKVREFAETTERFEQATKRFNQTIAGKNQMLAVANESINSLRRQLQEERNK